MKTQIKTKDLQKIINPLSEGLLYKNQRVIIDLAKIKSFVKYPKSMNIFESNENIQDNLFRSAALYIINSKEPKFISIDVDQSNPIQSGIFEYIKSIYLKEPNVFISIPETGDNLILIKSRHLIDLQEDITLTNKNPEKANDIEFGQLSSIFLETRKITTEDSKDKVVENDRFFWKEESEDLYSNPDFLLEKIKDILKGNKYSKDNPFSNQFFTIIKKANNDLVHSDTFKLSLLELDDYVLTNLLITHQQKDIFSIDFSKPVFQNKIAKDIKNDNFIIFKALFNLEFNNYKYTNPHSLDFVKFINTPEVVEHLKSNQSNYASYRKEDKFSLIYCYKFFDNKYKEDNFIIEKFISGSLSQTMHGSDYMSDEDLFSIPIHKLNETEILSKLLKVISPEKIKSQFDKAGLKHTLLSSKDFLLTYAHDMRTIVLFESLIQFHDTKDIDKDFVLKLVQSKPGIYSNIKNYLKLSHFANDIDIIFEASQAGLKNIDIPLGVMSKNLIQQHCHDIETFKLHYLIECGNIGKSGNQIYTNPEDILAFNTKYDKLEYTFFQKGKDWFRENKSRDKTLSKIKTDKEIFSLIDNINNLYLPFNFDSLSFYKALHPDLKNNITIVDKLSSLGKLKYSDLSETLQYNQDVALLFINKDYANINLIPKEFFNDIGFSLEFAKIMDSGKINLDKEVPLFINKFFENQGVKDNFYQNLKTYISYSSIKDKLITDTTPSTSIKKMKI
jgi:hypothetical protein